MKRKMNGKQYTALPALGNSRNMAHIAAQVWLLFFLIIFNTLYAQSPQMVMEDGSPLPKAFCNDSTTYGITVSTPQAGAGVSPVPHLPFPNTPSP